MLSMRGVVGLVSNRIIGSPCLCIMLALTVVMPALAEDQSAGSSQGASFSKPPLPLTADGQLGSGQSNTPNQQLGASLNIGGEYHLQPNDLLEITVFQAPELSRTVRVGADGMMTLPLIGGVQAGGLSSQQLESSIAAKLREKYLQDPQVSVFVKEFAAKQVTVGGYVARPGIFPVSGKLSLLQAVALAGGLDKLANEGDIRVFRQKADGGREMLLFDLEPIRKGEKQDPVLSENDVVLVGKSVGRSALKDVTETLRDLSIFGLFWRQ